MSFKLELITQIYIKLDFGGFLWNDMKLKGWITKVTQYNTYNCVVFPIQPTII
jgi:hypothetical protein